MEDFFDRFNQFIESLDISMYELSKKTSISEAVLSNYKKGKSAPTLKILSRLSKVYNVDLNWLLMGKSSNDTTTPFLNKKMASKMAPNMAPNMASNNNFSEEMAIYENRTDTTLDKQQIPLYDLEAVAGVLPVLSDINGNTPVDYLYIPNAPKCDGAIFATGDSMYPLLKSGDILGYKVITDLLSDVYWGQMYILHIEVAGDLFRTVKYIQKGKDDNHFRLVSQNKHHQDKEVLIEKIKSMAQVKVTVRIT